MWVEATGDFYTLTEGDPPEVAILGVVESRSLVEGTLAGWQRAMDEPHSLTWVLDRLARPSESVSAVARDRRSHMPKTAASGTEMAVELGNPGFRALLTVGMATATAALVLVVWLLLGLSNIAPAVIGGFLGMTIVVGFTPGGRDMAEDLQAWRSTRAAIGRRGLREARRERCSRWRR